MVYNSNRNSSYADHRKGVLHMPKLLPDGLTHRDMDILNVLWEGKGSLTASQIVEAGPSLTINTVQAVLRKLLKKKLIEIDKIVYSGTVLCRSYKPAISANEFALSHFNSEYQKMQEHISMGTLMASLLSSDTNPDMLRKNIDDLQATLDNYKKTIDTAEE